MNKQLTIPAILAAIACSAFTAAPTAHAANLPEMQVDTMIVASGKVTTSADTEEGTAAEADAPDTDDSAS